MFSKIKFLLKLPDGIKKFKISKEAEIIKSFNLSTEKEVFCDYLIYYNTKLDYTKILLEVQNIKDFCKELAKEQSENRMKDYSILNFCDLESLDKYYNDLQTKKDKVAKFFLFMLIQERGVSCKRTNS